MKLRRSGSLDGTKLKATRNREERRKNNNVTVSRRELCLGMNRRMTAKEKPSSKMGTKESPAHTAVTLPPTLLSFSAPMHYSWPMHASPSCRPTPPVVFTSLCSPPLTPGWPRQRPEDTTYTYFKLLFFFFLSLATPESNRGVTTTESWKGSHRGDHGRVQWRSRGRHFALVDPAGDGHIVAICHAAHPTRTVTYLQVVEEVPLDGVVHKPAAR